MGDAIQVIVLLVVMAALIWLFGRQGKKVNQGK